MAETTTDPLLSVVICHHRGDLIRGCLESLRKSVGVTYEIITVTSDTLYYKRGEDIVLYEQGGPAHKRNVGVAASRGQYLIFLDDDILDLSPYALYNLWQAFQEHPRAGMVYARIYNAERRQELDSAGSWLTPSGFLYAREGEQNLTEPEITTPIRCLAAKSAGCAVRREVFYEVGGFDASYEILAEESELSLRIWLRGYEVWWWPDAIMWHAFNTRYKPVADYYTKARIFRNGARNYPTMLLTTFGASRLVWMLPLHLLGWSVALLGFCVMGKGTNAWWVGRGLWEAVQRLPQTLRKRHQVQRSRMVSDRALMPHIARFPTPAYYVRRLRRYWINQVHG